jgi:hypothetical protein
VISVHPARRLVHEVDFRDLADKPLKHYRLEDAQQVDGRWFPKRVVLEHLTNGSISPIEYAYWLPEQRPPRELFRPDVEQEAFLPRLERYLGILGLRHLIEPELEAATRSVDAWAKRWGVTVDPLDRAQPDTPAGQHQPR